MSIGKRADTSINRRHLLRAAPAVLAVTVPPARPAPDAELVRLGAEFMALQAKIAPLRTRFFELSPGDAELHTVAMQEMVLAEQQDHLTDRMRGLTATTVRGFQSKAKALRQLYLNNHADEIEEGCLDEDDALAWTLVNDLLRLNGGAA